MRSVEPGWRSYLHILALCWLSCATAAYAQKWPPKPPAAASAAVAVAPIPAWVAAVAPDPERTAALPSAPVHVLLADYQTRVEKSDASRFVHSIRTIRDSAGLEAGARLQIEFDPAYQKLALHYVKVRRGLAEFAKLDLRKVQLLQRETRLERQIYDGRLTANLVLDDIRVGDQIEYAYTLHGSNPVFAGKFVDVEWSVGSSGPIALFRMRLLAPAERNIQIRAASDRHEVVARDLGAWRETVFTRRSAPQFHYDPSAPESVVLDDQIQFSEFTGWADVAAWAEGLFRSASRGASPAVRSRADALRAAAPEPAEQLRLALDFVQTEIRYLGTEIGANSHLPAPPETVLAQRFGDCKDKVGLLAALLAQLGIETTPVLVSTGYRGDVRQMLPSPLAFNHVVAQVRVGPQTWLLDATRHLQRGPLAERQSLGLGRGLPARADAAELVALPSAEGELRLVGEDVLQFKRIADDPTLDAAISLYGELAENVRSVLASPGRQDFEKQLVGEYARAYATLQQNGEFRYEELDNHNAVRIRASFALPRYLRFPEQNVLIGDFALLGVIQALRISDQRQRQQPFRLAAQGIYKQSLTVRYPEEVYGKPNTTRFDESNAHFELKVTSSNTGDSLRVESELKQRADRVTVADWPAYRDRLSKAWPKLSGAFTVNTVNAARLEESNRRQRQLEEDLRAGRVAAKTSVQTKAMSRLILIDAQLTSDRLSAHHRAQLLTTQGEHLDHLGHADNAARAYEDALRLEPNDASIHGSMAVNALLRRQDALAIQHASTALQLAPGDVAARYTRAQAHYFAGAYRQASEDLQEVLKDTRERERGYAAMWLYLTQRRLGEPASSAQAPGEESWPHPVLRMLTGANTVQQALSAAQADKAEAGGRLCELYYFLGEQQLLDGQAQQARASFQKALDTGVIEFLEHAFAKRAMSGIATR